MSHLNVKCVRELLVLVLTVGVLSCWTERAAGQGRSSGGITNVEATVVVGLRIEVHAADKPIAIPYCGENGAGEYFFCSGEAHLEVLRRGEWVPAKPRKGLSAVMGAEPDTVQKRLLVEPGKTVYFAFNFDKEFFGIQKSEHVRIRINSWGATEAIGNREAQITMSSPEVECP
jgi:hypothetical protein